MIKINSGARGKSSRLELTSEKSSLNFITQARHVTFRSAHLITLKNHDPLTIIQWIIKILQANVSTGFIDAFCKEFLRQV